jgi:hypothetical protein
LGRFWADCRDFHFIELSHLCFDVVLRQVRIDHRRRNVPMSERRRNRGEIAPFHHHQRCACMAQLMDRHARNPCPVARIV